jgi:hypothetical protein
MEIDELDELGTLKELDELDELGRLKELDELLDELDELEGPDELEELENDEPQQQRTIWSYSTAVLRMTRRTLTLSMLEFAMFIVESDGRAIFARTTHGSVGHGGHGASTLPCTT